MKTIIFSSIFCCVIALPGLAELTPEDLDKIRLIIKDEVKTEMTASEKRIKTYIDVRTDSIEKRITQPNNILYALIALIIFAIGLPAWQNRRDRDENKKIEALTKRLEALEQQRSVSP